MTEKKGTFEISAAGLHVLGMLLMLCDHVWATVLPAAEWLTCIGRVAFPIFAFMIVEGYFHTRNLRRYLLRMLVFALVSEIPFDLMYSDSVFYPYHQNVLWTFLISLVLITLMEKMRERLRPALAVIGCCGVVLLGFVAGYLTMVDYYGVGVLTVVVFYFFRKRSWQSFLGQLVCLYVLNVKILGGYYYELSLFGYSFALVQQGLALLALVPIWLYRGRQGTHSKTFQYVCYGFYPVHMVLLFLLRMVLLR